VVAIPRTFIFSVFGKWVSFVSAVVLGVIRGFSPFGLFPPTRFSPL
jgi:hypothetical protein